MTKEEDEILLLRAQLNQEKERADRLEKVLQSAQPPDKFLTNLWTAIHSYCAAGGGQNRSTAAMNAVVAVSRAVEEQMLGGLPVPTPLKQSCASTLPLRSSTWTPGRLRGIVAHRVNVSGVGRTGLP